ncbi:MAG: flagellar basal body rod protein FlgB [Planococcus sp. (in: firmicutes)]|uniref:flagellar basal body rod protein FlgB n=1 Tax=Planococcus alpniumensis TaxID=2708345 RepID=UPI001B8C6708|nr:flagellar basal body rod protein FlgB [Planococcus sp. MSAK28401]MDN5710017.1 flagellar basal body rod protein FlgB [Planococcus sp. (in: firmicutes)]
MNIFPSSIQKMEQALSTSTLKQRVHAGNIANVDTANYKSKQVNFQQAMEQASASQMKSYRTDTRHLEFQSGQGASPVTVNHNTKMTPNGNNVDMDFEMAELAKNQLWYNAVTERVNGKLSSLSSVINGGR